MILNRISTIPDARLEATIEDCIEVRVGRAGEEFALDPLMLAYTVEHLGAFLTPQDDPRPPTPDQAQALQMALGALCALTGATPEAGRIDVERYLEARTALREDLARIGRQVAAEESE